MTVVKYQSISLVAQQDAQHLVHQVTSAPTLYKVYIALYQRAITN